MKLDRILRVILTGAGALALSACGPKIAPKANLNGLQNAIRADQSMRQVLNQKWSCSHSDNTAVNVLPYRKLTVFNDGDTQSVQLAIHYADTNVPTVDLIQVDELQCYYSAADVRIVKCVSKLDPTLKIETSVQRQYDQSSDLLSVQLTGAASSFAVYFGGKQNRLGTLMEFKARYQDPFQIRVTAPDTCGFVD